MGHGDESWGVSRGTAQKDVEGQERYGASSPPRRVGGTLRILLTGQPLASVSIYACGDRNLRPQSMSRVARERGSWCAVTLCHPACGDTVGLLCGLSDEPPTRAATCRRRRRRTSGRRADRVGPAVPDGPSRRHQRMRLVDPDLGAGWEPLHRGRRLPARRRGTEARHGIRSDLRRRSVRRHLHGGADRRPRRLG